MPLTRSHPAMLATSPRQTGRGKQRESLTSSVIPGRALARTRNPSHQNFRARGYMDSGFASSTRPGMTTRKRVAPDAPRNDNHWVPAGACHRARPRRDPVAGTTLNVKHVRRMTPF